jgi:4-amino-4-deoxy-L-arabinose transferase-like glycosyltransferase
MLIAVSGAVLLATLGISFLDLQRAEPAPAGIALVAAAAFLWATGWLAVRPALAAAVVLDTSLIFAYLWSFNEQVPITVSETPQGYIARVGDTTVPLPVRPGAGTIGLYSGGAQGHGAQPVPGRFGLPAPLAPLAPLFGLATPRPAWSNITITGRAARPAPDPWIRPPPGWSYNRRGELEAGSDAAPLLVPDPGRTYQFSAGLMRGDGAEGVLIETAPNRGYLLLIRSDQDRAYWVPWNGRPDLSPRWVGRGTHVPHLSPALLPMVQRTLLVALPSVILALTLLLLAVPVYGALRLLIAAARRLLPPVRKHMGALSVAGRENTRRRHGMSRVADLTAVAIAVWGTLVAAYIAAGILKAVPNVQDSVAYLFQARLIADGRLWAPIPRLPAFFQQSDLLMYDGHWFGKYAPGWPLLLAAGVKLGAAWLVNPILLGGCLLLTYLIGTRLYGRTVALLGTAFAAGSPFLLYFAGTYMAHTAALFCFLAAAYLLVLWHQGEADRGGGAGASRRGWRFLAPAGLLLGMAAITRQLDTIGLILPFACLFIRRPRAIAWVAVPAAIPVALGLAYNRALTGSVSLNPYVLVHPWDRLGFGSGVGDPAWHVGYTPALGFWNLASNIQLLQANLFGWPYGFAFALAALPFLIGRARRWDVLLGASAAGLFAVYLAYFYSGDWLGFPRYTYGAIPWLALLTARGVQELYELAPRLPLGRPAGRPAALALPLVLSLGLIAYTWTVSMPAERTYAARQVVGNDLPLHTVGLAGIHHALVFTRTPRAWWRYGAVLTADSPLVNGDVVFARDLGPRDRQLMRLYPGRGYYRLNGTTLTAVRQ